MQAQIEDIYSTIGQNIQRIRKRQGVSQGDLATFVGYQRPISISEIEHGKVRIHIHTLLVIAHLLDVTVQELITPLQG